VTDPVEAPAPVHETPLADRHEALGARMIEFAGWRMPVQYTSIVDEHRAVRDRVGLFDLSHMGELWVEGTDAAPALAAAIVSDPARLAVGRAQYSMICETDGGIIDDLIVYRLAEDRFMVVANAGNAAVVSDSLAERLAGTRSVLDDHSLATGLVAIQGPRSVDVLRPLTDVDLDALHYYAIADGHVAGIPAQVARTGYTGEDGFEVFVDWGRTTDLWDALLPAVQAAEGVPVGLGARDTLRLEAGMRLHGNDIDETTTAVEADLNWIVGWKKDDFIGAEALREQKASGPARKIVGFEMLDRGIARHGYDAYVGDAKAGTVTSGTQTPHLKKAIGMAYLPVEHTAPGTEFDVDIRGRRTRAKVVPMPFYKRAK
jgi:aminomethyltransferase